MTTIEEIENLHIEHRLDGLSESFVFKPSIYSTYGAARKAMRGLISIGYTGLTQSEQEIVGRWSLIENQTDLDNILKTDEQDRIRSFHNSHMKTMHCEGFREINIPYYSSVTKELIYDGIINSEIVSINIAALIDKPNETYSARIYDVKNSKVIAEKTGLSNNNIEIIDLGEILYHPTNKTVLELQVKRETGGGTIISSSFELKFL